MFNCILLVIAFAFLPPAGKRSPFDQDGLSVYRVTQHLRGRVLGSLVKQGMTRNQVEGLLGKDPFSLPTASLAGGIMIEDICYGELGLTIGYMSEWDEKRRVFKEPQVSSINFCYLFGAPARSPSLPPPILPGK